MCRFIESIKIENRKPLLLALHQKRVDETFKNLKKENPLNLFQIVESLQFDEDGIFKMRMVYDLENDFTIQIIPYKFPKPVNFELIVCDDLDYNFKYENRNIFENLKRKMVGAEMIIVKKNAITDTSFSNLLFCKNEKWYTPKTYLLNGVQRQNLIILGEIKEAEITINNIKTFSHFKMINAMNHPDDTFAYPIKNILNLPKI
jgi:4-amino-4-deoxychorismate lyase